MKIIISNRGHLALERKGGLAKEQDCPFTTYESLRIHCGDWCPLFGEPEVVGERSMKARESFSDLDIVEIEVKESHRLRICERIFSGEIVDERVPR